MIYLQAHATFHRLERKSNVVLKHVPFENKQSSQIRVFEKLAISFVAFFVPTSSLTPLIAHMLAFKSTFLHGRL
jgi:hypothetical protein